MPAEVTSTGASPARAAASKAPRYPRDEFGELGRQGHASERNAIPLESRNGRNVFAPAVRRHATDDYFIGHLS
jgi:hypothetical protein